MGFEDISENHRSQVWQYFWRGYGIDKDFSKCQLCNLRIRTIYGSQLNNASPKLHLELRHNIIIQKGPKVYIP